VDLQVNCYGKFSWPVEKKSILFVICLISFTGEESKRYGFSGYEHECTPSDTELYEEMQDCTAVSEVLNLRCPQLSCISLAFALSVWGGPESLGIFVSSP
jgi:hypothetical protein